ncbi:hypothetical protein AJ80_06726 [Polytolypa hystricis UAMH7299]|uniref:AA9 family lytic polysaccharide monooxygenase n=1 Tax=Polytolypa hystricis (strain UAMH7299) TaxID=1447883 RepID=A0A2B7XTY3_POLH7|nr:hypothetical protein AJ80_06726 [Polytolypa hystricis UAMH7299]
MAHIPGPWEYVRQWTRWGTDWPVWDIRCNVDGSRATNAQTLTVAAGTQLTIREVYHEGPMQYYIVKVPEGEMAATWDEDREAWFKMGADDLVAQILCLFWSNWLKREAQATLPKALTMRRIPVAN